ncbi:MAG TPA: nucleotidyl transferase AbiEii/AbiGii toxin family protein [Candidatus Blautia intestinavium]|nr:nucleotidyl transferase AbiEii/AbiGii toxin family protein [Candidatus Blautia intestinavium]
MYLHSDKEMFKDVVEQTAAQSGKTPVVVEKDYYVTLILKLLSEQLKRCVFKGGTSLSKGYHVINRFSEDIDITFKEHIGESRRKKLKNVVLN